MPRGGVLLRGVGEEGFTALTAQGGAGALRLAGDTVDGVVLDVDLPDADGRDVCQTLWANGFFALDISSPPITVSAIRPSSGFSAGGGDYLLRLLRSRLLPAPYAR